MMPRNKKRGSRYVYIEGSIWRLTDLQFSRYLAASVHRYTPISSYGRLVGHGINVTRFDSSDFAEALRALRAEPKSGNQL